MSQENTPTQYTVVYEDKQNNSKAIWYYDKARFQNGPVKVEIFDLDETTNPPQIEEPKDTSQDTSIPLTKRYWTNPANGKLVGYARAKGLGLI
jgi:hypothetical protein